MAGKLDAADLRDHVRAAKAEVSLAEFVKFLWPVVEPQRPLVWGEAMDAICLHLEAVAYGHITRLLLNVPPGMSKSLLCNVFFPAWLWGPLKRPSTRFLTFSYSSSLTERDNGRFALILKSDLFQRFWGEQFRLPPMFGNTKVENNRTGRKIASSVGGVGTGERGDIVVCFPPDEVVWTETGPVEIGTLVRDRRQTRVWSTDVATGRTTLEPISGWHRNPGSPILNLRFSNGGTLRCTPDHRLWTVTRGWVAAADLVSSDVLPGSPGFDRADGVTGDCEATRQDAVDAPEIGNEVEPFVSHDGEPDFIRVVSVERCGYADETFCLTVDRNHTFYAGRRQYLVRNCDDVHNVKDGESEAKRIETVRWFAESITTRLNDPAKSAIIVVMQRVHEYDVSGHIIANDLGYTHCCLPMEYDGRHCVTDLGPMGVFEDWRSEDGELLFPERFPAHVVERDKTAMGPFAAAGQLQQAPTPRGGGILKRDWWQVWPPEDWPAKHAGSYPPFEFVVASLDTAFGTDETNDYNALTIWGIFRSGATLVQQPTRLGALGETIVMPAEEQPKLMLMYGWQKRLDLHGTPEERPEGLTDAEWMSPQWRSLRTKTWGLVEWVVDTCRRYRVDRLLIEDKSRGHDLAREMRRLYAHESYMVDLINPGSLDKVARAYSVQHLFANGQVWAPGNRDTGMFKSWAQAIIDQASSFPKAQHDDAVDSSVQALRWLRDHGMALLKTEVEASWEENLQVGKRPGPLYDT